MKDNNTDYQNDNSCNNSNISLSMAVISVIATLLPIIIGLALWNKLPDELPVHWGGNIYNALSVCNYPDWCTY